MWLFHSVTLEDLSAHCFRRKLLEYCLNPTVRQETVEGIEVSQLRHQAMEANRGDSSAPLPFDSWFEVDVFLRIADRACASFHNILWLVRELTWWLKACRDVLRWNATAINGTALKNGTRCRPPKNAGTMRITILARAGERLL